MLKINIALLLIANLTVYEAFCQDSTQNAYFDFVLSDTSVRESRKLFLKLKLEDECGNTVVCVTDNANLYTDLKTRHNYNFQSYKAFIKKILRGDTLVSIQFFSKSLVNDIVDSDTHLDSIWNKNPYHFLTRYTCHDKIVGIDEWSFLYYAFDMNINTGYSHGGRGNVIYFDPAVKEKIDELNQLHPQKIIYNEDGSVRDVCDETTVDSVDESIFAYQRDTCHRKNYNIRAFIQGAGLDTISISTVKNGFTLRLTENAFNVSEFTVSTNQMHYTRVHCLGNKITSEEIQEFYSYSKIFIDNIRISNGCGCYTIPPLMYHVRL